MERLSLHITNVNIVEIARNDMKNSKLLVGVSIGLVLLVSLIGIVYFSTPNEPMEPTNARHYNINVTDNFIVDEKKNSAP